MLAPRGSLLGKLVVVTAGPTYEDIDAVRYIGNRSSGTMGYALAAEAARRGARVVLVSGPSSADAPGERRSDPRPQRQRRCSAAVHEARRLGADIVVMAAAVADYTPQRTRATARSRKSDAPLALASCGRRTSSPTRAARAAPSRVRSSSASPPRAAIPSSAGRQKLRAKRADMIVANDISATDAGFDAETNAVTIITADGDEAIPLAPKSQIAVDRSWTAPRSCSRRSRTVSLKRRCTWTSPGSRASPFLPGARRDGHQSRRRSGVARRRDDARTPASKARRSRLTLRQRSRRPSVRLQVRRCNSGAIARRRSAHRPSARTSATARAASCTRSGASRSCSASGIRTRT